MTKLVSLRSEVLYMFKVIADYVSGLICASCGGVKSSRAHLCQKCWQEAGADGQKAVRGYFDTASQIEAGRAQTNTARTPRQTILGPVLCRIKVSKDANLVRPADAKIAVYLQYFFAIMGGVVEIYVFGAKLEDLGHELVVMLELKIKQVRGDWIPYLRAQVVEGLDTDIELVVGNDAETYRRIDESLPHHEWDEDLKQAKRHLTARFGFRKTA